MEHEKQMMHSRVSLQSTSYATKEREKRKTTQRNKRVQRNDSAHSLVCESIQADYGVRRCKKFFEV